VPRDGTQTRERLKQAARDEFSAVGPTGTTVERIAARAGVNKERLYRYFGSKERLFATVLSDELRRIAEAVPIESLAEVSVGEFAGRVFDYHSDHPQLVRLLHWEGLVSEGQAADEAARTAAYQDKVRSFARAQRDGRLAPEPDAARLYFLVLSLAAWWSAVPQVARMLTGRHADDHRERASRRAAVVEAAERMAGPGSARAPLAGH
jgi:AcrR family transcriptional regulator